MQNQPPQSLTRTALVTYRDGTSEEIQHASCGPDGPFLIFDKLTSQVNVHLDTIKTVEFSGLAIARPALIV